MDEPIFSEDLTKKLYNEKAVLIGTFLGGPLVAAYLMGQNFKALGQPSKVGPTWLVAVGVLTLAILTAFLPPLDKIPSFVFSFIFCVMAYSFTKKYQGSRIAVHQAEGGAMYKTGRAALIGVIGLVVIVALSLGAFYLADQTP